MERIFEDAIPVTKTRSFYDVVFEDEETINECKKILGLGIDKTFEEFRAEIEAKRQS